MFVGGIAGEVTIFGVEMSYSYPLFRNADVQKSSECKTGTNAALIVSFSCYTVMLD